MRQSVSAGVRVLVTASCFMRAQLLWASSAWYGSVTAEGRAFFHQPQQEEQNHHGGAGMMVLGWRYAPATRFQGAFESHWAYDPSLERRYRLDVRELHASYSEDVWRLRLGVHRVAWGASDVVSVVDVINQRDGLAWPGLSNKLGQPMVMLSIWPAHGRLDVYYLPAFREFPFPGERGRLRPSRPVATEHALFETGSVWFSHDYAARYTLAAHQVDMALHVFEGRNRMPYLVPDERIPEGFRPAGIESSSVFLPLYENILQIGGECHWAAGAWLWKAEAAWREGLVDTYVIGIGGFERSFWGVWGGANELSLIIEYGFDTRGKSETSNALLDNDIFIGGRWAPGDMAGTGFRGGILVDLQTRERVGVLQAERRVGHYTGIGLDALWFSGIPSTSRLEAVRRDDFVRLRLTRYF